MMEEFGEVKQDELGRLDEVVARRGGV